MSPFYPIGRENDVSPYARATPRGAARSAYSEAMNSSIGIAVSVS